MTLQFPHLLCLIFVWLFLVCPLLISHPRTVHGLPTLYTCLILWLLPVCLFMSHCMTVHGLPAAYVSSYDCCQSASYDSWSSPVCLPVMSHLMTVPSQSSSYDSSCDCSRSAYSYLILWLFMIHPLFMSHLMTVSDLSASYVSFYDCSQSAYLYVSSYDCSQPVYVLWLFPVSSYGYSLCMLFFLG